MSEKTIAEQFEDEYNPITTCMSSVKNAIERIERRLSALEGKPKEAREWKVYTDEDAPEVWWYNPQENRVYVVSKGALSEGDLWMPYDPEHPEPPAPPEVK